MSVAWFTARRLALPFLVMLSAVMLLGIMFLGFCWWLADGRPVEVSMRMPCWPPGGIDG